MTYDKIKTLLQTGAKWSDDKQLFSLIYQKQNLDLDDLDNDNDVFVLKEKDKSSEFKPSDFNHILQDEMMDIDENKMNINQILFKEVFKLYDRLIIQDYLTDVHTVI